MTINEMKNYHSQFPDG
jgi:hypothetical protein